MSKRNVSRAFLAVAIGASFLGLMGGGCGLITAPASLPEAFTHNAWLGLKGTITDEQGFPVDDVLVKIDKTYYLWHAEGSYDENSTKTVVAGRRFDIPAERAHELSFDFRKSGYSNQTVTVEQEDIAAMSCGCIQGSKWPLNSEVKIILRKNDRALPRLAALDFDMDYTELGKVPIADFADSLTSSFARAGSDVVRFMATSQSPPPHALYTVVERQPLKTTGPEHRVDPLDVNLPARLSLHISDADGGFVRIVPQPGSEPFDQMLQAPADGYAAELTFDDKRLRQIRNPANDMVLDRNEFFYFRTGGKYGKAILNWSQTSDETHPLRLHFAAYLQPDGTRNLASSGMPNHPQQSR